jgi:hypothetical protein
MRRPPEQRRTWGILLALLLGGLASACARGAPGMSDRIQASALRHLPKESVGIAVVEMKALREREAAERWLEDLAADLDAAPSFKMIRQALGPDVLQKVDRVALALVPQESGGTGYAVLAEGTFEEPRMRQLTGGQEVLTLVEVAGQPDVSLTVLPGGTPVFGSRSVLQRVRGTGSRKDAGLGASSLIGVLGKVQPAAQIWGAIDYAPLVELARRGMSSGGHEAALSASGAGHLKALAFQGVIDKSIAFDLFGQAEAEPGAKQLADAARGLVALARMSASQQGTGPWLEFLDGIRIDQSGREVEVHGTLTSAIAQALAGQLPGLAEGVSGAGGAAPKGDRPDLPQAGGQPPAAGTGAPGASRPPG